MDSEIDPIMLSSFVGALRLFGDNFGKIEEINIKGLHINMIIVYKYNLILVAIMDKDFVIHNIRHEAEKALDMFYSSYCDQITNNNGCVDVSEFDFFKDILYMQIEDYFENLEELEKNKGIKDFGFFTDAIAKLKKKEN